MATDDTDDPAAAYIAGKRTRIATQLAKDYAEKRAARRDSSSPTRAR